jgi:hypothetical protein
MYQAQAGAEGLMERWIYRARVEEGWCLVLVGAVYAAAHLGFGLVVSTWTDLWSRRAFVQRQQQGQQELLQQ